MAFRTYSLVVHGIPLDDKRFKEEDTYVTVVSTHDSPVGGSETQVRGEAAIKNLFTIIYEGPSAFNHFHGERVHPSQKIIIFEKKCPQKQKPVLSVSPTEKIPGATTL